MTIWHWTHAQGAQTDGSARNNKHQQKILTEHLRKYWHNNLVSDVRTRHARLKHVRVGIWICAQQQTSAEDIGRTLAQTSARQFNIKCARAQMALYATVNIIIKYRFVLRSTMYEMEMEHIQDFGCFKVVSLHDALAVVSEDFLNKMGSDNIWCEGNGTNPNDDSLRVEAAKATCPMPTKTSPNGTGSESWSTRSRARARRWMVTQGNHDIKMIKPFHRTPFTYILQRQMAHALLGMLLRSPSNLLYSFQASNVHVIMLGSYTVFRPASDQFRWLQSDLKKIDR
ncbi:hypothetical protein C2S52_019638 [Perilla frutescens var. hirtella]|nr:hypothetical protein C2S52_019638 [Perilla frutescens var. hirtella]